MITKSVMISGTDRRGNLFVHDSEIDFNSPVQFAEQIADWHRFYSESANTYTMLVMEVV